MAIMRALLPDHEKRPMHCPADLTVDSTRHCRGGTRLTHPVRPHLLAVCLHAKRNSKQGSLGQKASMALSPFLCCYHRRALLSEVTNALCNALPTPANLTVGSTRHPHGGTRLTHPVHPQTPRGMLHWWTY